MNGGKTTIDITSATIFRVVLILVGFWFVYLVVDVLLLLFAAIVVAAAIEPIASFFQRYHVPRPLTVALVYVLVVLVLVGVLTLMIEPLTTQVRQLAMMAPNTVNLVRDVLPFIPETVAADILGSVQQGLMRLGDNLTNVGLNIFYQTRTFVAGIFTTLFVFVLAFYLTVERDALKKFVRIVTPAAHLAYVEDAINRANKQAGRWMLAQLALGLIIGVIVWVGLTIIGVPYALLLGIIAGVLEIIPYIGPIIAAILGVLIGFSQSLVLGLVVLLFYVAVQQFENHVLVPNVMRKAVGLHPLTTIIAILLGARLAGVVGIILAIPLVTVLSVFLSDIFSTRTTDDELAG